jgi:hypothetical protein
MAKAPTKKAKVKKGFEDTLWDTARGKAVISRCTVRS